MQPKLHLRRWIKEPFCGLSHGAGAVLAVVALVTLLLLAQGKPRHLAAFSIYGATLFVLFTSSALYHSLHVGPKASAWLQRFDYCAIFLLIAGTYTPVCLVPLRGAWGWSLLAVVWSLAALGIALSVIWHGAPHWMRVALYVVMGWLAMIAIGPLRAAFSAPALAWLVGGGLIYSAGTVIYALDRPHLWPGRFSAHDLWHVFVLGGAACHFIVMACFVAPAA